MSIKTRKLQRTLHQATTKITLESDGKGHIVPKITSRRSREAAIDLITPANAGSKFRERIARI